MRRALYDRTELRRANPHRLLVLLALAAVPILGLHAPAASARAGAGCPAGGTLSVVAHEDDSILFQDPDIRGEIANGRCVRTVFVTAGDAGLDAAYWLGREAGVRTAYADLAAQPPAWTQKDAGIPGHRVPMWTLDGNPRVSLVFLRLPDGQSRGRGFFSTGHVSLEQLWGGVIPSLTAVDWTATYTKDELTRTLLAVMTAFGPDVVRTQNFVDWFGDGDHSDHHATALFTKAASEQYAPAHKLVAYAGYNMTLRSKNLAPVFQIAKEHTFFVYAPYDREVCQSEDACVAAGYAVWWSRQYVLATLDQGTAPPPTAEIAPPPPPPAVTTPVKAAPLKPATASTQQTRLKRLKAWCRTHPRAQRCRALAPRSLR